MSAESLEIDPDDWQAAKKEKMKIDERIFFKFVLR